MKTYEEQQEDIAREKRTRSRQRLAAATVGVAVVLATHGVWFGIIGVHGFWQETRACVALPGLFLTELLPGRLLGSLFLLADLMNFILYACIACFLMRWWSFREE